MIALVSLWLVAAGTDTAATTTQAVSRPAGPGPAVQLTTIAEPRLNGFLVGISPKGIVTVARPEGTALEIPLDEVVSATFGPEPEPPSDEAFGTLYLVHGDRWRGRVVESTRTGVVFESALFGRGAIPFSRLLAYVLPKSAGQAAEPPSLDDLLTAAAEQDQVYLASGDRIPGVIEVLTPTNVVVSGALGRSEHPAKDVLALVFSREGLNRSVPATPYAALTLTDGSVLSAEVQSMAKGELKLKVLAGFELALPAESVYRFAVRNGRLALLADLDPAKVTYVPFYNRVWPMRRNLSVWGRPLTVNGRPFATGLGLASKTTVVYALDGKFDTFEAQAGIDDETQGKGKAILVIQGDGRPLVTKTLVARQAAVPIRLDVSGIRELTLVVDFGPEEDVGDHVDLGDARLIRTR